MSLWPPQCTRPMLPIISTVSFAMAGVSMAATVTPVPNSTTNPFTTFGVLAPFSPSEPIIIDKAWWYNGTTAAGNVEFGIYTANFDRIFTSGQITVVGTSVIQETDINFTLDDRLYYLALNINGATCTYFMSNMVSDRIGQLAAQSYYIGNVQPLPTNALSSISGSTRQVPLFGVSVRPLVA